MKSAQFAFLSAKHRGKRYGKAISAIALILCSSAVTAGDITLYAAASLTDVLTELSDTYQKKHPGIVIKKSFAGSSTLARQIENGAPADIFISADNDWTDYLQKRELLLADSKNTVVTNELVLIAPSSSKVRVKLDPEFNIDASFSGRLCTGDTASVPAGKYAKQSLVFYNWWDKISSRIVGTEDVRTALAFVERAGCSLGIVYKTDAKLSKKVKVIATFPANSHKPIEYPGVLIKNANEESKNFWMFLQSNDAKIVYQRYGFTF